MRISGTGPKLHHKSQLIDVDKINDSSTDLGQRWLYLLSLFTRFGTPKPIKHESK